MAIAIEGYTIVAKLESIDEKFDGGKERLLKMVPNATALDDGHVWRCSFMAMNDARDFLGFMSEHGLETNTGPDSDSVIVNEFDLSVQPYCEWLIVKQWQKGVIAWLEGSNPEKLFVREGWTPEKGSGLQFARTDRMDNLEYVRRDGNVEVYKNKETGEEVFIGRTQVDHEQLYRDGSKTIVDNMIHPGQPPHSGNVATKIANAIEKLEQILAEGSPTWQVHWLIGKGQQALGKTELAYQAFRKAWAMEQGNEAIPRELGGTCLELGYAAEAVEVGQKAAAIQPDNPETLGNLACAYLLAARLDEAKSTIEAAIRLAPNDSINRHIQRAIQDVRSGAIPQPKILRDLTHPKKQKKESLWNKMQFWKK